MKTMSCVLQAKTGEGEGCPGVLQLFPQCYLHPQTSKTNSGPFIKASDSWSDPTTSKCNRSDTYCHSPTATSTKGSPSHVATSSCNASTLSCNVSTLSSPSSTCSGFAFFFTTNWGHPAQHSSVVGGLLGRRRVLSDWSYQTIKTVQPVQPLKSHPVWALVSLTQFDSIVFV